MEDFIIGKMVEVQSISINNLSKGDKDGTFKNEILLSPIKQFNSRSLASESELHRILGRLSGEERINDNGYKRIPSYFTLDVGKNKTRYKTLIESNGELIVKQNQYVLDDKGNKILSEKDENGQCHYIMTDYDEAKYVAAFCGAGHSREQKNLFVEESIADKMNDIILCGIPKDLKYDRPSKWNAYYAMVCTDSTPVSYTPNIVVIPDYTKNIFQKVDLVEVSGNGDSKVYNPIGHKNMKHHKEPIEIMPFDGAGLITPQCALKWAKDLDCKSSKGNFYLPSCFQFRAIPGIKGEVMVFDLKRFARERKVSKIIDLGGREWDIFKDKIDVILTQSQFKFYKQYLTDDKFDYWLWRNEFDKECHGYKRTFNIVSYGAHPDDLKENIMLSYQPEQTLSFTDDEIPLVSRPGIELYRKVTSSVDEFLKFRQLVTVSEDTGAEHIERDKYIPPYYVALIKNKELFYDKYVRSKIEKDILKLKNNLLSGKLLVRGNYQVFMPDLYGLAEWAFRGELGEEPRGLLKKPYHIYSDWWNDRGKKTVDIIRNPSVGMEHRIGHIRNNRELKKWFKYQTTGIVTGMYDTMAMALGTADFDGDTVCTTDNQQFIDAVIREFRAGNGRLIIKKEAENNNTTMNKVAITDRAALMKINSMSFNNSIGTVIDKITDLWSMIQIVVDDITTGDEMKKAKAEEIIRKYIMIGVIVGGETIDFAKTGENASFPKDILTFLKSKKKGYWMRYLEKNLVTASREVKSLSNARLLKKSNAEIEDLKKFETYNCNMNRLCFHAETEITLVDFYNKEKISKSEYGFDHRKLLMNAPSISRNVYRKLLILQKQYQKIAETYRKDSYKNRMIEKAKHEKYRWFYDECRTELLLIEPDINKLLDMLIMIYYGDTHNGYEFITLEKDILWNVFPQEMIKRCSGKSIGDNINIEKLKRRYEKNIQYSRQNKECRNRSKRVMVKSLEAFEERPVVLTKGDRRQINIVIDNAYKNKKIRKDNAVKIKKILALFVFLSRKTESIREESRALRENGHLVKDSMGKNVQVAVTGFVPHWMKLYSNTPDELTAIAFEKMIDVNHKYMLAALCFLAEMGLLETKSCTDGSIKFKVHFNHNDGEVWIDETDYNKAGQVIKDYFRK